MLSSIIIDSGGWIPLLLQVAILGLIVWAVLTYIPMEAGYKIAVRMIGIAALVFMLCHAFGVFAR